jgi:prepilin peptidase CpaA
MLPVEAIISLVFMVTCLYGDLRHQRIPNLLTVPMAATGLLFHWAGTGFYDGGLYALKGLLLGVGLLFIPFMMGGMGGGDVKCLGALGAWMGPVQVYWIFIYGALAGGLLSLFLLIPFSKEKGFSGVLRLVRRYLIREGQIQSPVTTARFPYTIALTNGLVAWLVAGKIIP